MISVVVATFNGEEYLRQQLDSILSQLTSHDELIITDDHSTDQTAKIIESYLPDDRIRVLAGPGQGLIANFEQGIIAAQGDIIFLADQDDIWLPTKVQKMRQVFEQHPTIEVVIADLQIVDEDLQIIEPSYFAYRHVQTGFFRNIIKNKYIGAGMAFRKRLKAKILPFPTNLPMHDMWIGLLAKNQVALVNEPLTLYRRHQHNASEIATSASWQKKFQWRRSLIQALIQRLVLKK